MKVLQGTSQDCNAYLGRQGLLVFESIMLTSPTSKTCHSMQWKPREKVDTSLPSSLHHSEVKTYFSQEYGRWFPLDFGNISHQNGLKHIIFHTISPAEPISSTGRFESVTTFDRLALGYSTAALVGTQQAGSAGSQERAIAVIHSRIATEPDLVRWGHDL